MFGPSMGRVLEGDWYEYVQVMLESWSPLRGFHFSRHGKLPSWQVWILH